jgi:hypothetical protein
MPKNKSPNKKSSLIEWISNLGRYKDYSLMRKCISIMKSIKLMGYLMRKISRKYPKVNLLANKISWQFNRFVNPKRYLQFADERKWVFIVGCTNSGTSLLHKLLAPHPDIASLPHEGQFFTDVFLRDRAFGFARIWSENLKLFRMIETHSKDHAPRLIHDWKNYLNNVNASVVIEKTPTNSIRTRWLQAIFKNSYFIAIVRDGRAVAEGISRRVSSVNIERAATHWVKNNNIILDDAELLNKFHLVRYEELVENPQNTVMELIRFIEEDPEKYKFDFNRKLTIHNVSKKPTAIKNFNQGSFDRIPKNIFDEITSKIQPTMKRLGYHD